MTREELVRIIRDSVSTSDIEGNPATFDPPEWALRAVKRAYERGQAQARVVCPECDAPADHCANCGKPVAPEAA